MKRKVASAGRQRGEFSWSMSVSEVVMADGQDAPLGEVLREPFVPQKVFAHSVRNLEHESRFATLRAVSRDPVLPVR